MSDYFSKLNEQTKQIQNAMNSIQEENAKRLQHQHDAELANISTAKTLQEMVEFMQQEKQDRIKSDNSARHYNIAIIVISSLTLAATIATVIIGVLTMLG